MALTGIVAQAFERAVLTHNLLLELQPTGQFVGSLRNRLFHALCDLTVEHFGAIISLIRTEQHYGSAFALLRPLNESCLRAFWILDIADETALKPIAKGEKDIPSFAIVRSAVESYFAKGGVPGIFSMDRAYIETLHGLTHSGMEQLLHRFADDLSLKPTYPDTIVNNLLNQAARFSVMATIYRIQQVEGFSEAVAPQAEALQTRFTQIMGV